MHAQVSSQLSAGGSPGKLAQYTRILADQKVNIRAIGGSEWDGQGAVAVLVDGDMKESELAERLTEQGFPSVPIYGAEAVLPDEPGSLATAAELIGDLNILTILVADTHGGVGLVSFGFATEREANTASRRLGDLAVKREHNNTKAWDEHEAWDATNPNPRPDPSNPNP
jgi:hypothetical protein